MKQIVNSNDDNASNTQKIKFLYSYGGKILPRRTDGVLRYVGGHTRVLSVDRSITFAGSFLQFLPSFHYIDMRSLYVRASPAFTQNFIQI